jgi:hypothetical protein
MISVAPDLRFLPVAPRSLGFLFDHSLCLFMVWHSLWQTEQCTLFFYLVEVTQTIHIISVTLLHIVHLITEPLLLMSPLPIFRKATSGT